MIKLNPYRITYSRGTTQVIFGRDSKDACARSKVNPKTIRVLRAAHDVNPMWEEDEAEQVQFELGLTGVMFALAGGEAYLAYLQRGHEQNRADRLALRYLRFVVANNRSEERRVGKEC